MEIFYKLERLSNSLEVEKYKLNFPQHFNSEQIKAEIKKKSQEIQDMVSELNKIDGFLMRQDLMSMQLTKYIKKIERNYPLPFSKSQNYIGKHYFYTKPYSDVKNILFNDFRGIMGVSLFLTTDENDAVTDKENFKNLLVEIRQDVINSKNMVELFRTCENFIEKIKKDFC